MLIGFIALNFQNIRIKYGNLRTYGSKPRKYLLRQIT